MLWGPVPLATASPLSNAVLAACGNVPGGVPRPFGLGGGVVLLHTFIHTYIVLLWEMRDDWSIVWKGRGWGGCAV